MATKPDHIKIQLPETRKTDQGRWAEKWRVPVIGAIFLLVLVTVFAVGLVLFLTGPQNVETYEYRIARFSGSPEVYSQKERKWFVVTRATQKQIVFGTGDQLKTGEESDIDLEIPVTLVLRLKPSSEIRMSHTKRAVRRLKLKMFHGSLLGISTKAFEGRELEIETPVLVAGVRGTAFMVHLHPEGDSSVSVLEGTVDVQSRYTKETTAVKALEILKTPPKDKSPLKPRRVNYQEWRAVAEARDLLSVDRKKEAEQIDLRKKAGSFFKYVFDEGVFFKPDWGYAGREFYEEEKSGPVTLRIDYDVFPQGSFSGMYFKTRDFDLSKFKRLAFSLKAEKGKPLPSQFRIELKDRLSIVRGFSVKPVTDDWRFYAFDFNAQKATPVSEIVFVFENSKVGVLGTNGTVYIKDLNVE